MVSCGHFHYYHPDSTIFSEQGSQKNEIYDLTLSPERGFDHLQCEYLCSGDFRVLQGRTATKAEPSEVILNDPFCSVIGRLANELLMDVRVCSRVWFGISL